MFFVCVVCYVDYNVFGKLILVGSFQINEGGNEINVFVVFKFCGEFFCFRGMFYDFYFVFELLDCCFSYENVFFEGVVDFFIQVLCYCCEQVV